MPRLTVSFTEEQSQWIQEQAEQHDLPKRWVIQQAVDAARGEESAYSDVVRTGENSTHQAAPDKTNSHQRLAERVDDLEARLADLEANVASDDAEASSDRAAGGEREPDPEPAPTSRERDAGEQAGADVLKDLLEGWRPGRAPGERREAMRAAGRAAVELLQEDGGPLQRAEFEELWERYPVPDQAPPSENDTYWRKSLRPALQAAIEADLARQAQGSWEYYWVGPEPESDDVDDDRDRAGVDAAV